MSLSRRQFMAITGAAGFAPAAALAPAAAMALAAVRASAAVRAAEDWQADFNAFVSDGMAKTHTPGLAVALVRKGRTILAQGYGYADIAAKRPVTVDTAFHIASVSKTVTGTAMMMLWQEEKFGLDDPVNAYLDFPVVHPTYPDRLITFRHLMTHTSGISDSVYNNTEAFSVRGDPVLPLRDFLTGYLTPKGQWYSAEGAFGAEPGTVWAYSNVAIALLGYITKRFNTDLKTLTHDRLFAPLGMHTTSWTYAGLSPEQVATPYDVSSGTPQALPPTGYPDWPAGLLRTSAHDFARFLAIYTQQRTLDGRSFLTPSTLGTMLTPETVLPDLAHPDIKQALIWQVRTLDSHVIAAHSGGDPGALTVTAVDMAAQSAVLVFANASGNPDFRSFQKEATLRLLARGRQAV